MSFCKEKLTIAGLLTVIALAATIRVARVEMNCMASITRVCVLDDEERLKSECEVKRSLKKKKAGEERRKKGRRLGKKRES